jgi:SAM-dependent methyltransferase
MTWVPSENGLESRKCRHRIMSLCTGRGLDLGCGLEKISDKSIGIDRMPSPAVDMQMDLTEPDALRLFADGAFDYVFSSHCLEDIEDTAGALKEWWRVIRYGGHLILYGPDPDYYPRIGTIGSNVSHRHDLYWQEVWEIIKSFGNANLVSATRHNESNEYSWLLCVKKMYGLHRGRCMDCPYKKGFLWRLWQRAQNAVGNLELTLHRPKSLADADSVVANAGANVR